MPEFAHAPNLLQLVLKGDAEALQHVALSDRFHNEVRYQALEHLLCLFDRAGVPERIDDILEKTYDDEELRELTQPVYEVLCLIGERHNEPEFLLELMRDKKIEYYLRNLVMYVAEPHKQGAWAPALKAMDAALSAELDEEPRLPALPAEDH